MNEKLKEILAKNINKLFDMTDEEINKLHPDALNWWKKWNKQLKQIQTIKSLETK